MGICFSKKTSSSLVIQAPPPPPPQSHNPIPKPKTTSPPHQQTPVVINNTKKEIFFIKQRNSHERQDLTPKTTTTNTATATSPTTLSSPSSSSSGILASASTAPAVRTSSCTKEEVDAILIQCGRLSRSSSGNNNKPINSASEPASARKYSGSKRSYDFDHDTTTKCCTDEQGDNKYSSQPSHRRTPSRERDVDYKRSGSRSNRHRSSSTSREEDRKRNHNQSGGGSTSRRLSRSPARRSETPTSSSSAPDKSKGPAKMVSVPASTTGAIKRVSVKRTTASPRSQSPANARENTNAPSLSRNSSRKAEHSPYRRNPLAEIDDNSGLRSEQINNPPIGTNNKIQTTDQGIATKKNFHFQSQKSDDRNGGLGKEQKNQNEHAFEAAKFQSSGVAVSPEAKAGDAGIENLKLSQTTITRSRSSRRSRDLDFINDNDVLVTVPTSYASILLEDIQNFHHKNSNTTAFSLPPCVAKACSIVDAVADLNSSTNSNISSAFSEERNSRPSNNNSSNSHSNNVCSSNVHLGKTKLDVVNKDPFVEETEVLVNDDLMEPSIHKYITVRRGMTEEMEQQESSGSNSIVGQQWFASSSWEPSSADSTDHWNAGQDEGVVDKEEPSLLVHKVGVLERSRKSRSTLSTSAVTLSGKKRELDHQKQQHQLGKVGAKTQTAPIAAAASM